MLLLSLSAKSIFVPDTLTSENSSGLWEDENFITGSILTICKEKKKNCDAGLHLNLPYHSCSKALKTLKIVNQKLRIPCGKCSASVL